MIKIREGCAGVMAIATKMELSSFADTREEALKLLRICIRTTIKARNKQKERKMDLLSDGWRN